MDMTETENHIVIEEADLQIYVLAYKSLKDSFRGRTRFVLLHIEDDIWEVRVINLTSREWLEYCATVFAELPSETVNLAEEAAPISEAAELGNSIPFETYDDGELEDAAAEEEAEEEYDDTEYGQEEGEEEEEDTTNEDGETPSEEAQRKLRKAKIVRKTGNSAVTVETD